jgi:hypothetical protein
MGEFQHVRKVACGTAYQQKEKLQEARIVAKIGNPCPHTLEGWGDARPEERWHVRGTCVVCCGGIV